MRSPRVECPLCHARRGLALTPTAEGKTLAYCHACRAPQVELRAALPDLDIATRAGPTGVRLEAPGVIPNAHEDVPNPIPGAMRP